MIRHKKTPFIPMLTGVTLAFVLASVGFIGMMVAYNNPFTQVEQDTLPDFVGLKFETVSAQYSGKYDVISEEPEYNEDYGAGLVFSQRPRAGTTVKLGSPVRVSVSLGPRTVTLPNFEGKDAIQTYAKLRDLGIKYTDTHINSDTVPIGSVIYTEPSKDHVIGMADVVTVFVSQGPEAKDIDVPDLKGFMVEDAVRLLENRNLRLGSVSEETSDKPAGTIIAQDPLPGLKPEGTTVNVVVSKEGSKLLNISIPLPAVDRIITIRARSALDDSVLAQFTGNPMLDLDTNVWKVGIPVPVDADGSEFLITTYIDGQRYIEYYLNPMENTYRKGKDRSDAEEFQ